jgi:TonB family protein
MAKKDFQVSRDAWATAFDMADAGEGNVEILRANTLIGRGATFLGSRKDLDAIAALEAFNQALARLAPLTPERDDDNTTPVQILYAQALAWSSAARALIRSQPPQHTTGSHLDAKDKGPPSSPLNTGRPQLGGKPPLCPVRFKTMPRIFYPTFAENSSGVGAVVMRLKVDAAGTVLSRNVVASIPTPEFGESVRAAEGLWVVEPAEGAPAGCRLESADLLMPVHFVISQ